MASILFIRLSSVCVEVCLHLFKTFNIFFVTIFEHEGHVLFFCIIVVKHSKQNTVPQQLTIVGLSNFPMQKGQISFFIS